jgi:hypothetical protein
MRKLANMPARAGKTDCGRAGLLKHKSFFGHFCSQKELLP